VETRSFTDAAGRRLGALRALALTGCAVGLLGVAQARADVQQTGGSQTPQAAPGLAQQGVSATLEQCATSLSQTERSATFAGEMSSLAGAVRMEMRIDVQERLPAETRFHTVHAPGLGVWRASSPEVKTYKYLKQVTNLSAPAYYRANVRFRWLAADGHTVKELTRHTPVCYQSPPPPVGEAAPEAPQTGGAGLVGAGSSAPALPAD
jgi:hypothetical protein